MKTEPRCRIAYLISKYPDFSHTFILREVLALRERGLSIDVASINDAPAAESLTAGEREEVGRTFYVKSAGVAGVFSAALWALLHRPFGVLRSLVFAIRIARGDIPRSVLCIFYWVEAMILAQWMYRGSHKHLHVHFATPAATVALILTRMSPVTMSLTVHGPDEFYDVTRYYLSEKIATAKFVICISFFAQSQLMKVAPGTSPSKFELARLGVDTNRFVPRISSSKADVLTILCVGRLVSAKGQSILIEAVARLRNAGRSLVLELVGDGPDRVALENLVRERGVADSVRFVGVVNQDAIKTYYDRADIFVLASFAEGIPVVLMEAMAMEIPCISTCITGIPELIADGVDGLLVAPSDIEGTVAAITRFMDSPDLRRSLGEAGRRRVMRDYELSKNADHLAEVFLRRLEQAE